MLTYGEKRAINEIRHVLKSQWKNGMLPHIRFVEGQTGYSPDAEEWGVSREISGNPDMDTSGITQPPNVAIAAWKILRDSNNKSEVVPFIEEMYPGLKKYHTFLLSERDPEGEGLAAVFHPWAAGTDNAPCYDELVENARKELSEKGFEQRIKKRKDIDKVIKEHRPGERDYECYGRLIGFFVHHKFDQKRIYKECPFVVKDVMFNSILKEAITCLGRIALGLANHYEGKDKDKSRFYEAEHEENNRTAERVAEAIRTKLYDEDTGLFYNYDVRSKSLIRIPTIHSLVPLFGSIADKSQAKGIIAHIKDKNSFFTDFPIPTTPIDSEKFENVRYWRGPVWPATNWLIIQGLKNYDNGLSRDIKEKTIRLILEGFENKNPDELAASLMEYNSHLEEFTTPSNVQYQHGWLWDSGFAAMGWRHVKEKASPKIWEDVDKRKHELASEGLTLEQIRKKLKEEFKMPLFDEYYTPLNTKTHSAGDPLGAEMMTWTAALFLDLLHS